jgi:hypothetical protein
MGIIKSRRESYPEVTDIEHVEETLNRYRLLERERQRRLKRKQYLREYYMKRIGLK